MAAADVLRKALVLAPALALSLGIAVKMEGVKNVSYPDPATLAAPYTICAGHTGGVQPRQMASDDLCAAYLVQDVAAAHAAVNRLVKRPVSTAEEAAMADFVLNAGSGNFARSTLLKKVNRGDRAGACLEYPKWGPQLPGIVKRRQFEKQLCQLGVANAPQTAVQALVAAYK